MSGTETKGAADQSAVKSGGKSRLSRLVAPAVVVVAAFVLSVGLAAAAAISAFPDKKGGANSILAPLAGPIVAHKLPEFTADLKTSRTKAHYVHLSIIVETPEEAVEKMRAEENEIAAKVQARLRDLTRQQLAGAEGMKRVRGEIIAILDEHVAPERVRDVLFTQFLVD